MKLADLTIEKSLWSQGFKNLAGIDEVGRGSWAGPVVAAAVVLPNNWVLPPKLTDSKLLKAKDREILAEIIKSQALAYTVVEIGISSINKDGVGQATQKAFRKAINKLAIQPDFYLVDGFYIKNLSKKKQWPIIKGDQKSASIAAASIIAKVYRDRLMVRLGKQYPQYCWAQNKGYGTKLHQSAIKLGGLSALHRTSFNLYYLLPDSLV